MKNSITISVHFGSDSSSTNLRHNCDKDYRKNLEHTDNSRPIEILENKTNEYFELDVPTKVRILENFEFPDGSTIQDHLDEYNKGKKPSRQKTLEDLARDNTPGGNKFFETRELILQVGSQEQLETNWNSATGEIISLDREDAVDILRNEYKQLEKELEGRAIIIQAAIHDDEGTPHLHLVFLPINLDNEKKRGLPISTSHRTFMREMLPQETRQAIADQQKEEQRVASLDYDPATMKAKKPSKKTKPQIKKEKEKLEFTAWRNLIVSDMTKEAKVYGYQVEQPNRQGAEHINTNDYREAQKMKADAEETRNLRLKVANMKEKGNELDQIKQVFSIEEDKGAGSKVVDWCLNKQKENKELKEKQTQFLAKIQKIEQEKAELLNDLNKERAINRSNENERLAELIEIGSALKRCEIPLEYVFEAEPTISKESVEALIQGYEEQSQTQEYERSL